MEMACWVDKTGIKLTRDCARNAEGKDFSVYFCHPVRRLVALDSLWLQLALTDWYTNIGDQMTSSYWVQISLLNCDPREQLEDEINFLVKAQSLPHIPLK